MTLTAVCFALTVTNTLTLHINKPHNAQHVARFSFYPHLRVRTKMLREKVLWHHSSSTLLQSCFLASLTRKKERLVTLLKQIPKTTLLSIFTFTKSIQTLIQESYQRLVTDKSDLFHRGGEKIKTFKWTHLSSKTLKSETRSQTRRPLRAALDEYAGPIPFLVVPKLENKHFFNFI